MLSRAERQPPSGESGGEEVLQGRSPAFTEEFRVSRSPGGVGKGSRLKETSLPQLVLLTGEHSGLLNGALDTISHCCGF